MPGRVDFYFDYISGYAYFAWLRLQEICDRRGAELGVHPVLFAGLLDHWGQLGPAEIPPKREWAYKDAFRVARLHGIELSCPKYHPFNPLLALRLSLPEVGGAEQRRVVTTIFRAGWGQGIDLGSRDELAGALDREGLDSRALIEQASAPAAKEALRQGTERAVGRGVFGVPTTFVGDELFWGSDRMDHVELALDGRDPLDHARVREALARPRAADRRKARPAGDG
ncbi:2-hydroxychromene-2-carboxylate isomerase [Sorangium sp. So ce1182]|uniref:2-hydroxychromene-2-carboxylate isomerase n=1 Tax=Sorangium sp. So ce1182 TaxID=3133334 RepID=UPI003F5F4D38